MEARRELQHKILPLLSCNQLVHFAEYELMLVLEHFAEYELMLEGEQKVVFDSVEFPPEAM